MATTCCRKISSSSGSLRLRSGCNGVPFTSTGRPRNSLRTLTESRSVTGLSARTTRSTSWEAGRAGATRQRSNAMRSRRRTVLLQKRRTPLQPDVGEVPLPGLGVRELHRQRLAPHEVPAQADHAALANEHRKELQIRVVAGIVGAFPARKAREVVRQAPFGFDVADPEAAIHDGDGRAELCVGVIPGRKDFPCVGCVDAKDTQQLQIDVIESRQRRGRKSDRGQLIGRGEQSEAGFGELLRMEGYPRLEPHLVVLRVRVQQVERLETLRRNDRCEPTSDRRAQPPVAERLVAGFDEHPGEMLRQDAAEILPFIEEWPRDAGLQVLAVMMVVVPDTGWLVIATDPDHRVLARLPAELEALEVALVVREEIFAKELERASLDAEQGVDLNDLIDDFRDRRRTIEG